MLSKNFIFLVCVSIKLVSRLLYSLQKHGKKWCWSFRIWWWNMNKSKKTLKENLILQILLTELNIILHDLKKWDAEYKSVININLAEFLLKITIGSVKTQASILKSKFGVNQHDKFLCKKIIIRFKTKTIYFNWGHNRRAFCFILQNWFYF